MPRCPTCRSLVRPRAENPAFPFCSVRCRAIDLGRWFIGNYRVPGESAQERGAERTEDEHDGDPN
jgi:endogenous inhibitor of DNA gyrase (YacG/DUF329 family)